MAFYKIIIFLVIGLLSLAEARGAFSFWKNASNVNQKAYVKASTVLFDAPYNPQSQFGFSVSADGDTLAVGAYLEDSAATGIGGNQADNTAGSSGAVYVFTRTAGVWSQQAYIKASNTEASDSFGSLLSLSGDSLAVTATQEDSNATGIGGNQADNTAGASGAVYVFGL